MRQLIIDEAPDKKGLIKISGDNFHYLRQVLRVKCGSMVNVRLKNGELFQTTVAKISDESKKIVLQLCNGFSSDEKVNAKISTAGPYMQTNPKLKFHL